MNLQKIFYTTHHDELTGLLNRTKVFDEIKNALKSSRQEKTKAAILFLDLNKFKPLNDTMGHDAGDAMLKETAARLLRCTRENDIVFRIGGDEFVVLIKDISDLSEAKYAVSRILKVFEPPMMIHGKSVDISISIGIAVGPDNSEDPDELLKMADIAMYATKNNDKIYHTFFDKSMMKRSTDI